jgi:hypothetical protein
MAMFALAWAPPTTGRGFGVPGTGPFDATATAAESSGNASVTIGLQVARTNPQRQTLDLRGNSISRQEPEAFDVDTHIRQIPCPGEYLFHADEEDSSNGNSSSYRALVKLFHPSPDPAGAPCGGVPPPLPGRMTVLLQDRADRLLAITGKRSNAGAFEGGLTLSHLPECDKTYTLEAALDLASWSRRVEFKLRALEIEVTLQGKPIESERC